MEEEIKLLEFLRSKRFILYVTIFTVIWLAPNSYYVFFSFCVFKPIYREITSGGIALIIASAIMIYTLRKNHTMATYYAWFEFSISAYYYISTIGLDWGLIPALSFAAIMPLSVKNYAKEIENKIEENATIAPKNEQKHTEKPNYQQALTRFLNENPTKKPSDFRFSG